MVEVPLPWSRELEEVRRWATAVLASFELTDWKFEFTRAIRQLGVCRYRPKVIGLSRHHIAQSPLEEVRETFLHEVAHALVGHRAGHGPVWKAKAIEVGARPERCSRAVLELPPGRWRAVCGVCRAEYRRHRRPRRLAGWLCRRCGPERGALTWARSAS